MRTLGPVLLVLAVAAPAWGQPPAPPLVLPTPDAGLPGLPVSRPLQPVAPELLPPETPPPPAEPERTPEVRTPANPLGRSWDSVEFLYWWGKANSPPPLVTAGRGAALPVFGAAGTDVLVGGRSADAADAGGMRITTGWAVNEPQTAGIEASYFFLGTRSRTAEFSDQLGDRHRNLGRPFVDAITGQEAVVPVAYPGVGSGLVSVTASSRATGWEIGGVGNLIAGDGVRLNVSAGYRYFMFNEGLRVEQTTVRFPLPGTPPIMAMVADQFDAHNRFHGGQIGLHADMTRGPLFLAIVGKIALGQTVEVSSISGQSVLVTGGSPIPLIQTFNSGVLGLPSNSGRVPRSAFAVLPEAQVKVGCKVGDNTHFFVGYNFLFLSEAIRAGDQVDRTLNVTQIPVLPAALGVAGPFGPDRPQVTMVRTDFWLQGLLFGFEGRY